MKPYYQDAITSVRAETLLDGTVLKINAIRHMREICPELGLKEAKELVEEVIARGDARERLPISPDTTAQHRLECYRLAVAAFEHFPGDTHETSNTWRVIDRLAQGFHYRIYNGPLPPMNPKEVAL